MSKFIERVLDFAAHTISGSRVHLANPVNELVETKARGLPSECSEHAARNRSKVVRVSRFRVEDDNFTIEVSPRYGRREFPDLDCVHPSKVNRTVNGSSGCSDGARSLGLQSVHMPRRTERPHPFRN